MSAAQGTEHLTDDALIDKYIFPSPRRGGIANMVVEPYVIPVWALIGSLLLWENATPEEVASSYEISLEAMQAAIAYYHRHKAVIEARIDANRSYGAS